MAQGRIARLLVRLEQVGRYQANSAGPTRKKVNLDSRNPVFKKRVDIHNSRTLWLNTIIKIGRDKLRKRG